ncbi:MAG: hypothetical protein FJ379_05785 [Verrucomicrobia bacterium]|nr:hypothetical protein [Verrucomicrobiota bacterium]
MEQRHQLRTGSESTVEGESTQKASSAAQRIETPEDLIRLDRDSIPVPLEVRTRLAAALQAEVAADSQRPWWRRWWDGNTEG